VVLVLNTCGQNRARLRRSGIAVASCPSTEQLLDAEQLLAERLLAEQLFDAEQFSHRRLAQTVVTHLESLLLRLAEKSSHVHITERVLYTEVQRKGSVSYHRDPAAIGFDLPYCRVCFITAGQNQKSDFECHAIVARHCSAKANVHSKIQHVLCRKHHLHKPFNPARIHNKHMFVNMLLLA